VAFSIYVLRERGGLSDRAQLGRQNFETKQQAVDYLNSLSSMSYEDKVKAIKEFNNMKRILSEV